MILAGRGMLWPVSGGSGGIGGLAEHEQDVVGVAAAGVAVEEAGHAADRGVQAGCGGGGIIAQVEEAACPTRPSV